MARDAAGISVDDLAEHQLHDPLLGARGHIDDADGLTLAQHGRAVAHGGDLDHAVRDEDHRAGTAPLAADHLEHLLGQVRGQGRGHLVEHQHVGLDRERARKVDDTLRGERHLADHTREIEALDAKLAQPVAEWVDRSLRQAQVRADVEVGDQRRLLIHGDDAAAARVRWGMSHPRLAANGDRSGVRPDGAGQDLDERALAGAVGAHERMNLTRANGQRGVPQRHDSAVPLRDTRCVEQQIRGGDAHRSTLPFGGVKRGMLANQHPQFSSTEADLLARTFAAVRRDRIGRLVGRVALDLEA